MAKKHWQIVQHRDDGSAVEGRAQTLALADAPNAVLEPALKAARLIGRGLYGVDLKEANGSVCVIEVNDNPNLVRGVEDAAEKDAVWRRLAAWFLDRLA